PRMKELYDGELRARLKDELGVSTVMRVPRVSKITINMGVGEAKTDAKQLDSAIEELTTIAGQRAHVRLARKSVAGFKVREGMPVGARVTLRGARMWEFLDRLVSIALPRIRDFRGLQPLRAAAGRLPEVRALPNLPAGPRPPGRHPGHDQVELVGGIGHANH